MVNNNTYILLIVLLQILFVSCQKQLTAEEYVKWVTNPENGLRKDQKVQDFEISVMYQPQDYIIAKENVTNMNIKNYESKKKSLGNSENFQIRIKLSHGGNILRYKQNNLLNETTRINHFSFSAKNDFSIITNEDTMACKLCHYSRNYNLTPTVDLSLLFDELDKKSDWQLIYKDKQFGLGTVKFLFKEEKISNIPLLKV